ncbi:MAG: hypothetical protein M5U28_27605 [Sandaracinaceae bacterium]|nr:hypothetical protein [Sandaracinaceae bacterium]
MHHLGRLALSLLLMGCSCGNPPRIPLVDASADARVPMDARVELDAAGPTDAGPPPDRGPLDPDAACASETATAIVERLPVDIVWVVDNSVSMQPAIEEVQAGAERLRRADRRARSRLPRDHAEPARSR